MTATRTYGRISPAARMALAALVMPVVLVTSLAIADVTTRAEAPANPDLEELLSGVDFVPPGEHLLDVGTVQEIIDLARDNKHPDGGLRIRAYRALAHFPGEETRSELIAAISEHSQAATGLEILYARAAMHSAAAIAQGDIAVVFAIAANLNHSSRDVRVAAAEALGTIGSAVALPALRERLTAETVTQVRLAISEAIRQLTTVTSK